MNKAIHGLVVVFFGLACWMLWGMLALALQATQRFLPGSLVPEFTRLCFSLRPLLVVLPILAAAYCVFTWFRRAPARDAWVGFFAVTMAVLVLVMLPTIVAAWLPLFSIVEKVGARQF